MSRVKMRYFKYTILAFIFISFAAINMFGQSQQNEKQYAEVLYISGSPQVAPAGEDEYIKAELGMLLGKGDKIRTDANSYIELGFNKSENNILRIDTSSNAVLLLEEEQKISIDEGRVFAIINELAKGAVFEVRTPTAVAGARGTEWLTIVEEDSTDVEVFEGTSYVKGFDEVGILLIEETKIQAGFSTRVRLRKRPSRPKRLPLKRRQMLQIARDNIYRNVQETKSVRNLIPRARKLDMLRREYNKRTLPSRNK
ncbi:MAG: FecR domain-containing protein [Candidatus Omnitrophica bacterium]|nr:FecR domain-containing protein [Candidatus Omnitrophota bacterium]